VQLRGFWISIGRPHHTQQRPSLRQQVGTLDADSTPILAPQYNAVSVSTWHSLHRQLCGKMFLQRTDPTIYFECFNIVICDVTQITQCLLQLSLPLLTQGMTLLTQLPLYNLVYLCVTRRPIDAHFMRPTSGPPSVASAQGMAGQAGPGAKGGRQGQKLHTLQKKVIHTLT
jgi:hypothetical protein